MTDRIAVHFGVRAAFAFSVMFAAGITLGSCAGRTTEQAPVASTASLANDDVQGEGRNTGTFPNLNVPPNVAAEQLTPEQREAKLAQLEAEKRRLAEEGTNMRSPVDPAQLKKLGETHARDALKSIEKK